jgi:hypothetical protein
MKEHMKKSRGVVYAFFITFILLLLTSPLLSQPVVLDAKPTAKVESDANSTTRSVLSKPDQKSWAESTNTNHDPHRPKPRTKAPLIE